MSAVKAVVTGATGVLGRAAVTSLIAAGHDVAEHGCVADVDSLEAAYAGADVVVNLAGPAPIGVRALLPGAWRDHDRAHTEGVAAVVEAARRAGVRRVVQESVSALYADQGDEWITELSPVEVTSVTEPVAVGESLVQDYTCGSRVGVVLRFGTFVGDDPQTRRRLRAAARGRGIGLGHPSDWAHVIHTDDLGPAVAAALHAPSGVYNVGAEPVERHELVQGYADAVGLDSASFLGPVGRWVAGPRNEPLSRSLRISSDHFASQTGWRASRPKFEADWLETGGSGRELHDARS